jgi:hypothetical protein
MNYLFSSPRWSGARYRGPESGGYLHIPHRFCGAECCTHMSMPIRPLPSKSCTEWWPCSVRDSPSTGPHNLQTLLTHNRLVRDPAFPDCTSNVFTGQDSAGHEHRVFRRVFASANDFGIAQTFGLRRYPFPIHPVRWKIRQCTLQRRHQCNAIGHWVIQDVVEPPKQCMVEQPRVVGGRDQDAFRIVRLYELQKAIQDSANLARIVRQCPLPTDGLSVRLSRIAKSDIDSVGEAITTIRSQCEAHAVATKRLAETSDEIEAKVNASEKRRDELQQSAADLLKNIEGLLAGATNACGRTSVSPRRSRAC